MSDTPLVTQSQLDILTRIVLATRESCDAALLLLASLRQAAVPAPLSTPQPVAPVAPSAPRAREVRVMGNDTPHVRGAMPHAPAPIPVTPLDASTIRAITDVAPAPLHAGPTAAPQAPTANEAGSSDAPPAS